MSELTYFDWLLLVIGACCVGCAVDIHRWPGRVWDRFVLRSRDQAAPADVPVKGAELAADYWRKAEQRFDLINGEVEALWQLYGDGHVEWNVHARDDRDHRRVERFLSEARVLGRVVYGLPLARKFPSASFTDDVDHWLNVVATIVQPSPMTGDGTNERGTYVSGGIDDLVDASKVACVRLASESEK